MSTPLPTHQKALVLTTVGEPLEVKRIEVPSPTIGSAIIRILTSSVLPYSDDVYSGKRPYPFPTPFVPGVSAIGRVAATGPDTAGLAIGDLVLVDVFIHGRDDPDVVFLQGLHDGGQPRSRALFENAWRDGTYAEYARIPLENLHRIPEPETMVGNPRIEDLPHLSKLMIPYGGFRDINLRAGETVIVAPATGSFGGCAVEMALAMGATVVAAARNADALHNMETKLANPRLRTVQLTGNVDVDTRALGPAHAFQDWSPPAAADSTHIKACIMALRTKGRASIMGGITGDVEIPYQACMHKSIKLCFKWMYEREDNAALINMAAAGLLKLGGLQGVKSYPLDRWKEAFTYAAEHPGWGHQVLLAP